LAERDPWGLSPSKNYRALASLTDVSTDGRSSYSVSLNFRVSIPAV
jgi:hypothetical protein